MRAPAMVPPVKTGPAMPALGMPALGMPALGMPALVTPARHNRHIRVVGDQVMASHASRGALSRRSRASRSHRLLVFVVRCRLGRHVLTGIVRGMPTVGPVSGRAAASSGIVRVGPSHQARARPWGGAERQVGQEAEAHRVREAVPAHQAHVLVPGAARRAPAEARACSVRAQAWAAGRRMLHTARPPAVPARTGVARGAYRRAAGPVVVAVRVGGARVRAGGGRAGGRCGRSLKLRSLPATSRPMPRCQRAM
jgi:hypothetical protein